MLPNLALTYSACPPMLPDYKKGGEGLTWHVLHTCISRKLHFSGFWDCHHRNRRKMLRIVALSLVMGIFEKVEPYLRRCEAKS